MVIRDKDRRMLSELNKVMHLSAVPKDQHKVKNLINGSYSYYYYEQKDSEI